MSANYKVELVGVLGQPVAENPTGVMQEAAFQALGLNWRYLNIEVPPEKLAAAMEGVRAFGMQGINLTIPHKVAVLQYLDELSEQARLIGAVNTVIARDGKLLGENTDGKGFLRGIKQDAGLDPKGLRVVMIGAGGASRAIATELLAAGVSELVVVNRNEQRGTELVNHLTRAMPTDRIRYQSWKGTYVVPTGVDLFVNATSIGLFPDVTAMPDVRLDEASKKMLVCDAVFNPPLTPLLVEAKRQGLRVLDGLSMLVYQGAIGFELWTGATAPEQIMKDALRKALGVLT